MVTHQHNPQQQQRNKPRAKKAESPRDGVNPFSFQVGKRKNLLGLLDLHLGELVGERQVELLRAGHDLLALARGDVVRDRKTGERG